MAQKLEPVPDPGIPLSQNVVDVCVINSTARIRCPLGFFVKDPLLGHETLDCPSYVFLIENSQGKKVLFDLGVRKDKESFPPVIRSGLAGLQIDVEKDIATILKEDGRILPGDIDTIIWRYESQQESRLALLTGSSFT